MNREELKKLLGAFPPAASDDEELAEALGALESDSELASWYEEECAFDKAFSAKLREVPVPGNLKESILAAQADESATDQSDAEIASGKIVPFAWPWLAAAAAAMIAVLVVVNVVLTPSAVAVDTWRDGMAQFAADGFGLDHKTSSSAEAGTWLEKNDAPARVPEMLAKLESMGCKALDWRGHRVSVVCLDRGDKKAVHLFVIDREALSATDGSSLQQDLVCCDRQTCGWMDNDYAYLLVGAEAETPVTDLAPGE